MRRARISVFILALLTVSTAIQAAVPQIVNYQGRLTNSSGDPVPNGANFVKFSIYDAAAGGTELWTSGIQNVTTEDGLFSYELGSNVSLPDAIFTDTARWLGMTVGGDSEISPRTKLASTPYAYHALRADTALFSASSVGVTQSFKESDVVTTGFLVLMKTDSINCPTNGFVMVNASLSLNCSHFNGDNDVVFVFMLDSSFTVTTDIDNRAWALPSSLPTGSYGTFVHIHKVFPVSAGWNEFSVLSSHSSGGGTNNVSYADLTTTMLFIPQSFGTVEVGTPSPPSSPLESLQIKSSNKTD